MCFDVKQSDTIYSLQMKIQEKEGILVDDQRLFFKNVGIDYNKTMKEYSINKEDTIYLYERLRGDIGIFGEH